MNPRFSSEGFPQGASSTAGLTGHPVTWMFRLPAMRRALLWLLVLQLCRPYSGAVICPAAAVRKATAACFNCAAPIPGRLSARRPLFVRPLLRASIVPPLFRGGYRVWPRTSGFGLRRFNCAAPILGRLSIRESRHRLLSELASIVPPLFQGGYLWGIPAVARSNAYFNRAAPIPGRLSTGPQSAPRGWPRFNCAAPIPGRLCRVGSAPVEVPVAASIVPPLFRGGYSNSGRSRLAYTFCFNCAAPIPGRL